MIGQIARRAALNVARFVGGALLGLLLIHWLTAGHDDIIGQPILEQPVKTELREGCWRSGDTPQASIPGHVIWQHPDGRTVYSKALTGPALDTLFGDGDLPGRAIAFCR